MAQGHPCAWLRSSNNSLHDQRLDEAGTFGLSIALPLWLDPPSLMRRPPAARLTVMAASALVLTLAWQGWPALIPPAGLVLYHAVAQRAGRQPVMATFPVEFWAAVALSASLGWVLAALLVRRTR